ncbi:hypothetical protein [Mesorhizobium sp. CN2-181]|uniref:hypothetical protein n=1 Tax=Mesorhizobium yinganensis TaxID=3157707 RepID=UPI0032B7DEB5
MAEVTNELIYRELLVLEQDVVKVQASLDEILALLRVIRREGDVGRAKIEATKARLGIGKLLQKARSPYVSGC